MDTVVTSSPFTYKVFQEDVDNSYDVWVELPDDMVAQGELLDTDGEPLDSDWHRLAMHVLIESLRHSWRHRNDCYVGGNMVIYYGTQARRRALRGPDFFFVHGVSGLDHGVGHPSNSCPRWKHLTH